MRVITDPKGTPMCYHCARPFERHPDTVRREEREAKLCAIEDDERAARAFHYYRTLQAKHDQMETLWVEQSGFNIPELCTVRFEGTTILLEPGASRERAIEAIEKWVIPSIKKDMLDALEPTVAIPPPSAIAQYDPTWCPATPSAAELYPSGYVRRTDGAVMPVNAA